MSRPDLQERVQILEDELAALESMLDSRTRTLWQAIENLRAGTQEPNTARKAQGGNHERSTGRTGGKG